MTKRAYHSGLRAERAAETRQRIVTAARELFATRGVPGTTVAAIAEQAGVAEPTVYATFGSKREIMKQLLEQTEQDADVARWRQRMDAEPDSDRKLMLFASWSRALFSTSHDVIAAVHRSPVGAELAEFGDRNRREALKKLLSSLSEDLRPDLTLAQAVDRAWMLTGPELYLLATDGCGWSPKRYETWLSSLLKDQLLKPAAED